MISLAIVSAMTILCAVWLAVGVRRATALMTRGVTAVGIVDHVSLLPRGAVRGGVAGGVLGGALGGALLGATNDRRTVTLSYAANGVLYTTKQDLRGKYMPGDTVTVLYDPAKPSRCFVL